MKNINIGINGFGRIGKCIFLQLLTDNKVNIKAININNSWLEFDRPKDYYTYIKLFYKNKLSKFFSFQ